MERLKDYKLNLDYSVGGLASKSNLDGQVYVFSDIADLALPGEPFKVPLPIFMICNEGSASVRVDLVNYNLNPGTLMCLLPNHIIQGYEMSPDFKAMFLGVSREYIEKISVDIHTLLPYVLDFKSNPFMELSDDNHEYLSVLFKQLSKVIDKKKGYYDRQIIYHIMHAMLYGLLNMYRRHNRYTEKKRSRSEVIFHNFVQLVEESFKVNRSVAFYAGKLCISPKHLSVVVKDVSGKTAGEWIDDYVILAAKALLSSSNKTIKEISVELNFTNQSFFGKFFNQHTGMSPNKFRTLVNTNPSFSTK